MIVSWGLTVRRSGNVLKRSKNQRDTFDPMKKIAYTDSVDKLKSVVVSVYDEYFQLQYLKGEWRITVLCKYNLR